jgi:hypothetical protein
MRMYRLVFSVCVVVPLFVAACSTHSPNFVAKEEPWRADAERSCLSGFNIAKSPFVTQHSALGGPSVCGALKPYDMSGTISGRVRLAPAATLQCQMIPTVDRWITEVVEPAAQRYLFASLVELKVVASYSCRPMNGVAGSKLSEHGHANAIDIAAFKLSDGRSVSVKSGWHGGAGERDFLHAVHRGACTHFTTVLGPNANSFHADHFHLDLARHGRTGDAHVCQ